VERCLRCSVSNQSISTFDAGRLSQGHGGEEGGARAVQRPSNSKVHEEGYVLFAGFTILISLCKSSNQGAGNFSNSLRAKTFFDQGTGHD